MSKFNYTKALKFPQYIQKITKNFSLFRPVRAIWFLVFMLMELFVIFFVLLISSVFSNFSLNVILQYVILPIVLTNVFFALKTQGKPILMFYWDLLMFYCRFGLRHPKRTITNEYVYLDKKDIVFERLVD